MIVILAVAGGIFTLMTIRREELPQVSMEMMRITTEYAGASPEDVEINVTDRIEKKLLEVPNIKRISSISMEGLSAITVHLNPEAGDQEKTKASVRDAVAGVTGLPAGLDGRPSVTEITNDYPLVEIALSGASSEWELRRYVRDLESRLRRLPGIGSIEKIGYRDREVLIQADPGRLRRLGVPLEKIAEAVGKRNVRLTGGTLRKKGSERIIVTSSRFSDPLEVAGTSVLANEGGYGVLLREVAEIKDTFSEPRVIYRGNGRRGIGLLITRRENADIVALSDRLRGEIAQFRAALPGGMRVEVITDSSRLTRTMMGMAVNNAAMGFVLVILAMIMMLDWRSTLWAAWGIPFTVLASVMLFPAFGITLNTVSLAAMIMLIGMNVDDAVIISERIYTLKLRGMPPAEAAHRGTMEMLMDTVSTSLTNMIGYLPILLIPGIMGRFSRQLPLVVVIILAVSLIESVTILPHHLSRGDAAVEPRRIRWVGRVREAYRSLLMAVIRNRWRVVAGFAVGLAAVAGLSLASLRFMLEEDINGDTFEVIMEAPAGTTLERTHELLADVEALVLRHVPGEALTGVSSQAGHHNSDSDYIAAGREQGNLAITTVHLKQASDRRITTEEITAGLRPRLEALRDRLGLQRLDLRPSGFSAGRAVEITYCSDDDAVRGRFERETVRFLEGLGGVTAVESDRVRGKDELRLRLDGPMLARTGLTAAEVARAVRYALDGEVLTSIRGGGEDIDYRLCVKGLKCSSPREILEIPVSNGSGGMIPLGSVARFQEGPGPAALMHRDGVRSVTVSADVDTAVVTSAAVNRMIRDRFYAAAQATPGLQMIFGGEEEEAQQSMTRFYFALVVALIGIYFILVLLFNSYTQPAVIMSIIPFTVAGSLLTLMLHGRPLVFVSLIGILGLTGVVVNDSIVMISHINRICRERGNTAESVADGAADRLRAIMLTTITTFAGVLPCAYGIGGDLPIIRPMMLVMGWGLLFTSAATLFFIPALVSLMTQTRDETVPGRIHASEDYA